MKAEPFGPSGLAGATRQVSALYDGATPLAPILDVLGVPEQRPVLVLVGWACTSLDDDTHDTVELLLRTVVAPVCRDEGAVVVTGGTDAGVMAALGKAVAEHAPGVILVGVAPDAKLVGMGGDASDQQAALPEPRHRLIRTPGKAWGAEGPLLVRVAEYIAGGRGVVVLAIGGGEGTRREIALAARRQWPVILGTGYGGTSDVVAAALGVRSIGVNGRQLFVVPGKDATDRRSSTEQLDGNGRESEELTAAREAGCHLAVPLGQRAAVERALRWRLSDDDVLKDSWTRFATADRIAAFRKKPTTVMACTVLVLATLTVLLTVFSTIGADWLLARPAFARTWAVSRRDVLKGFVTALPLAAAVLLGLIDRRTRTGSWIDLRAAAEAVIREIYRSRASAGAYAPGNAASPRLLGDALAEIDRRTSGRSLVPRMAAPSAPGTWPPEELWQRIPKSDPLLGPLTAVSYDQARVLDQLSHLEQSARDFDRQATQLATAIFVVTGAAAFSLALSWRWLVWTAAAAVLASFAAALVSWREYRQRDARAEVMLSTCVAVRSARGRWLALHPNERNAGDRLSMFVGEIEDALAAEGSDWERGLRQAHQGFLERQRGR
jgi:SLOG in TRPM, prokaryote/SMODS and SLOG-associating 2TM effector domain 1